MAMVLVIALLLRLINLNAGLWYDEILTLTRLIRLPPAVLVETYGSLNNHVLYTWLAKASSATFGESPWALRLPAVAFGVASIGAVWLLFREAGDRWAAVAAATLLAVSFHHVWFSQNARGYTGLLLFSTLAGFELHKALTTSERRHWFLYAAWFAAALLVHLSAAFLLVAHGLTVLIHGASAARKEAGATFAGWLAGPLIGFGAGTVVVALFFIPMLGGMIHEFTDVAGPPVAAASEVAEWRSPLWMMVESVRSFGVVGMAIPAAAVVAGIGVWRMVRAAPWIAVPYLIQIPLTLVVLMALSMRVWPRYFFIDIGFFVAAGAIGAFVIADWIARLLKARPGLGIDRTLVRALSAAAMILGSAPLLARNYEAPKQGFDDSLAYFEAQHGPDDKVATLGLASVYFDDFRGLGWPQVTSLATLRSLSRSLSAGGRLWVVTAFPAHARATFPSVQAELDAEFDKVAVFEGSLSGGDVEIYRSRKP